MSSQATKNIKKLVFNVNL